MGEAEEKPEARAAPDPTHRALALSIVEARHPDAAGALWAGSLSEGRGTATSDLDLVLLYPTLQNAWRETIPGTRIAETFVHDLDSLAVFFDKDRLRGVPVLATMVASGLILRDGPLVEAAKAAAEASLRAGPEPWDRAEIDQSRYLLTDARDDLAGARDAGTLRAIGAPLYEAALAFHRRRRGLWTAKGKRIPAFLTAEEPALAAPYLSAFDALFAQGEPAEAIALLDRLLAAAGGPLTAWRSDAPPHRAAPPH